MSFLWSHQCGLINSLKMCWFYSNCCYQLHKNYMKKKRKSAISCLVVTLLLCGRVSLLE